MATKEQLYDIALNGQGFVLAPDPSRPLISAQQDTIFGNRFAQGDRDYTDFSKWWYWAQTDWSGGIQESGLWEDTAQYLEGRNIDPFTVGGEITLLKKPIVQATDLEALFNTAAVTVGTFGQISNAAGSSAETAFFIGTEASSVNGSNGCRVLKSTDEGATWSEIIHAENQDSVRDLFLAGNDSSGGASYLINVNNKGVFKYDPTGGEQDITANMGSLFFGVGVYYENALYVWSGILATPVLKKSTDFGATSATTILTYRAGSEVWDAKVFNGSIYYLLRRSEGLLELRSYDGSNDTFIKSFPGLKTISRESPRRNVALKVSPSGNHLFIFLTDGTRVSVWTCDTTNVLIQKYKDTADNVMKSGGVPVEVANRIHFGNLIIEDLGGTFAFHNGRRTVADDEFLTPIAANGDNIIFATVYGNSADKNVYSLEAAAYYNTGYVVTNDFGVVSGIDKIFHAITLEFKAFNAGEIIEVEYSTDRGVTWTSIGTASYDLDGASATSKTIFFGTAVVAKRIRLRITLTAGSSQATTPTLESYAVQYLPMPDYRLNWKFAIKCQDRLQLKDETTEPKTAIHLRNFLRESWITKSILTFEDYDDVAEIQVNDNPLSSSATTINVSGTTDNFPERGRLLIESEEIFYNGKNKSQFLNCTRGARGTNNVSHAQGTAINTSYRVIISNYKEDLIIANEPLNLEYIVSLELREV